MLKRRMVALLSMICFVTNVALAESKYYGGELCAYHGFNCVKVSQSDTWAKLFPDTRQREIIKRLNRTNMPLNQRAWIVVPTNIAKITYMDLSPFPDHMDSGGQKLVIVNLGLQAFAAYDANGHLVHWGPVSSGKGWCPDIHQKCETLTGSFRIIEKNGPGCVSKVFPIETAGGAPMPYCMYYYRGFALHGSTLPGFNASHGCIRVFFEDAEWLNKSFVEVGTKVIVAH